MDQEKDRTEITNCKSCGAEFEASLPNCPYCGRMNLPAAESEYMAKLENMRDDLKDLGALPGRKIKAHSRKLGKKLLIAAAAVIVIAAVILIVRAVKDREEAGRSREEFLWQREAFAQMDELYSAGDWEALADAYRAAEDGDHSVWQYRHYRFCEFLQQIEWAQMSLREYDEDVDSAVYLFSDEIALYELEYMEGITEAERAVLEQLREPLLEDFEQRFALSEEELSYFLAMLRRDGFIPFRECEKFLNERGVKE